MNGFEAELKRLLLANGWRFLRSGKGSHEIWHKEGIGNQTIPHGCKSKPLANKILKQCKIDHKFP